MNITFTQKNIKMSHKMTNSMYNQRFFEKICLTL